MKKTLAIVILAAICAGCANTVWVPVHRDGTLAIGLANRDATQALMLGAQAGKDDPDKQVVGLEKIEVPLTTGQKVWRAVGGAIVAGGGYLIAANNEGGRFEHKDRSEDLPTQTQNYDVRADLVVIQNQNGGGGTQTASQEAAAAE